ncbi:spondin domain-containing protein [Thalassotalea euphylliae]|uniref:spondin domain-containing protein n=1 Tax=Thalassotalea euphylliae TaxID=1655234 RepID=UPI003634012E
MFTKQTFYKSLVASVTLLALTGCPFDDDDDDSPTPVAMPDPAPAPTPTEYSYEVSVINLTNAQPLSPIAVALHAENQLWTVGSPATEALEILAEGGDNTMFLAQEGILASGSGEGVVMPGMSGSVSVTTTDETATFVSIATMLVNTNDAFSGLTGLDLSSLEVDSSRSYTLGSYDAGTEGNTEAAGTIPGPADGGTGYIAERDDVDFVAMHPGVVSMDDGLTTSVLTQAHRFDNPTIRVTITRTK